MNGAWELVERDDERGPRPGRPGPRVALATCGAFQQRRKALDDLCIGASVEPPLRLASDLRTVGAQLGGKPEAEHVLGACGHALVRARIRCPRPPGRSASRRPP